MRFGKIILFSTFIYTSIANAQDVMVDLSVLDNLNAPQVNISKPLFPILPKKTTVQTIKATEKAKIKKNKKKTETGVIQKLPQHIKPIEDDIVVVDFEPASETQSSEISSPQKTDKVKLDKVKEEIIKEEHIPVKAESKAKTYNKKITETSKEENIQQPIISKEPEIKEADAETNKATNEKPSETPKEIVKSDLIIQDKSTETINDSYIKFEDDIDKLNDSQRLKIDSIVSKYKNEANNKIAIYSYNFDDGTDSFKKKRTCLNRAVEIRSYLLKKGYKNFSIKVININNVSDKINTVELQEI